MLLFRLVFLFFLECLQWTVDVEAHAAHRRKWNVTTIWEIIVGEPLVVLICSLGWILFLLFPVVMYSWNVCAAGLFRDMCYGRGTVPLFGYCKTCRVMRYDAGTVPLFCLNVAGHVLRFGYSTYFWLERFGICATIRVQYLFLARIFREMCHHMRTVPLFGQNV